MDTRNIRPDQCNRTTYRSFKVTSRGRATSPDTYSLPHRLSQNNEIYNHVSYRFYHPCIRQPLERLVMHPRDLFRRSRTAERNAQALEVFP